MRGRNIAIDVLRSTFPRHLRYDVDSQQLYVACFTLAREWKSRKYIPVVELQAVLDAYTPLPGPRWLRLPIVRHVLLLRLVNVWRRLRDKPRWLCSAGAIEEHAKVAQWLTGQQLHAKLQRISTAPAAYPASTEAADKVAHEAFVEQVMKSFRVATMYHRMLRLIAVLIVCGVVLLMCFANADTIVYMYLRHWRAMDRAAILAWFRDVTARHAKAQIPPAYATRLPLPCVRYTTADGRSAYAVHIVELVSEQKGVTVMAVPCPRIAPRAFYAQVGELACWCHGLLLECVPLEHITKLTPAFFLPRKDSALMTVTGVQYCFYDILRGHSGDARDDGAPPMLYPGGRRLDWWTWLRCVVTPAAMNYVYEPTTLLASTNEARTGWAWVRDIVDSVAAGHITACGDASRGDGRDVHDDERRRREAAGSVSGEATVPDTPQRRKTPYVLCVPWTVHQIASIEASLLHCGFTLARTYRIHWIDEDYLGEHFCDYYNIH